MRGLKKGHSKAPSLEHGFLTEIKIWSKGECVMKDVFQKADCTWLSDTQVNTLLPLVQCSFEEIIPVSQFPYQNGSEAFLCSLFPYSLM